MDQKTQFIADYLRRSLSVTDLFQQYGISRKSLGELLPEELNHDLRPPSNRSRLWVKTVGTG